MLTQPAQETARVTFGEDGTFLVTDGADVMAEGVYVATATHVAITLTSGDCASPRERTGLYAWLDDEGLVTLEAIDDACTGRREALTSVVMSRE